MWNSTAQALQCSLNFLKEFASIHVYPDISAKSFETRNSGGDKDRTNMWHNLTSDNCRVLGVDMFKHQPDSCTQSYPPKTMFSLHLSQTTQIF